MNFIVRLVGYSIIFIIVNGILSLLKQPKNPEHGKVYLPKFFAILGAIVSILFVIPCIITTFTTESFWIPLLFLIFSLLGASLIVAFINCRISYDDSGFVAKNFFGIKRKYKYHQVTAIKENLNESFIYIGKRRVMIDAFAIGGHQFISFVRKNYRKIHNGKNLAKFSKTKTDIFNGNIYDATTFLVVYIIGGILILGLTVFFFWGIFLTPSSADNTINKQVTFNSCVSEKDTLVLTSSDNQIYKIEYFDDLTQTETIKSICNNNTVVNTYCKEISPKDEDGYFSVCAIMLDNSFILSFEESNQTYVQNNWHFIFLPIGLGVMWCVVVTLSIIVGRNPHKYSKKFVSLFFKDGYVKY